MVAAAFGVPGRNLDKAGLLLALETFLVSVAAAGKRALLIVAVDLAGLTASALRQLLAARAPEVAVVAARQQPAGISSTTSDLPHPLCALWTPPALAAARRAWQAGSRSPRWVLADIACDNPRAIRLLAIPFTDRNTPPPDA